jgi:hypothetical protein
MSAAHYDFFTIISRMKTRLLLPCLLVASVVAFAQSAGVLSSAETQKITPSHYFYAGQVAPVQMRNAAAFRTANGKVVLAALVDVSGYSSAIAEKYQGLLLTDGTVEVAGKTLAPGSYGIGSAPDGKFVITDIGGNVLASSDFTADSALKRPVPLKMAADGDHVRLYLGKKYVTITPGTK